MAIPAREQRIIQQRSGNICAFEDCRRSLTIPAPDGRVALVGEMAHIVAESPDGPRGSSDMTVAQRNAHANLLLLCNTHHQLIDDPAQLGFYTVERLSAIKERHERWVERKLSHPRSVETSETVSSYVTEKLFSNLL